MVRALLVSLLAALLALAGVLVVNTLMIPTYQSRPAAALTSPAFDANVLATHLGEAIRFRTISWQDGAPPKGLKESQDAMVAFRDWISSTYPAFNKAATREIVGDYSLLYIWPGSDTSLKPILLMAHMDVVPVAPGSEGAWTHPPFSGDIVDGVVWGRGAMDLKVAIVCQLEAVESLIRQGFQPKRTIMFAYGHDEEIGGEYGNGKIAALLKSRNQTFEFINDEGGAITHGLLPGIDRPVAHVGVAEKGYVTLKLTAHSEGGHSSLPVPIGETAIGRLSHALLRLEANPFESHVDGVSRNFLEKLMPAMSFGPRLAIANLWLLEPAIAKLMSLSPTVGALIRTTSAPTMIHGGIKENVLPSEASLTINFRIHERDSIKRVVDHVRAAIDDAQVEIEIMKGSLEPTPVTDVNGPQYEVIRETLEKVVPDVIVAPNLISGGTDSHYYSKLTKSIFRQVPVEVTPENLEAIHGTNERVSLASVLQVANFYRELIKAADGPLKIRTAQRLQ